MRLRKILYPLSVLYGAVTSLRNKLFDWQVLPSASYDLPVISVGNITVGGTGKTPLTEYLIRLLKDDHQLALLSRGYKRTTKGVFKASSTSSASDIGDEPYQILTKYPGVNVVVAEKRVEGMEVIITETPARVVLMDDAYQHRYVNPGLSILVIDYNRPLWDDLPFPGGDLRETSHGQCRADVIVVNKCPQWMTPKERDYWVGRLRLLPHQQVFFTTISYGKGRDTEGRVVHIAGQPAIAVAGIARPEPFLRYLDGRCEVQDKIVFPDHHAFGNQDIDRIIQMLNRGDKDALVVTTEKDFGRLKNRSERIDGVLVYIPIELEILFDETNKFDLIIRDYVSDYQKNS